MRRVTVWLVVAAAALVLPPMAPARAHAVYERSDPGDGEVVGGPPGSVWAEFSEQPSSDSRLDVYDPCGTKVDHGDSEVSIVPEENRITVSMSGNRAGAYRVEWYVLSTEDSHPTQGVFTFTSSGGKPCPGQGDPDPDPDPEPDPGTQEEPGDPGDEGPGQAGPSGDGPAGRPGSKGSSRKKRVPAPGETPEPAGSISVAQDPDPPSQAPPAEPEMPLDGLLIALALAAFIGAAGGRIYAGIVGPLR